MPWPVSTTPRPAKWPGFPPDFEIGAVVALGYSDAPDKLSNDRMKEQELAERKRKPVTEIAFNGRWGQPLAK